MRASHDLVQTCEVRNYYTMTNDYKRCLLTALYTIRYASVVRSRPCRQRLPSRATGARVYPDYGIAINAASYCFASDSAMSPESCTRSGPRW